MAIHIKNERAQLLRRRELAIKEVESLDSALADKLRSLNASLEALGAPPGTRYARIKSAQDVATAILQEEQKWLTPREIANLAFEGGYVMDPVRGQELLTMATRRNASRGHFKRWGDKIGLNEWDIPDNS